MSKIGVFTDKFLADPEKWTDNEVMDVEFQPVDMNGGFVALDKKGEDNDSDTEENIRERFAMEPKEDMEDEKE